MTMSLVIGSAGVGKSTLLREVVLRGGSTVDVALHARNSTANEVAGKIAHALSLGFSADDEDVRAAGARELLARRLADIPGRIRPRPLIVVDSLDEARDHARQVARFLRVAATGADLVVALRTGHEDLVTLLHPALIVDLDSDQYFDPVDMVQFVGRVLAGEAPWLPAPDREKAVRQVSRAAGRNFLIGGLLALARATAPPEEWDSRPLPENVADAMRLFVDRLSEPERAWELLLLPALAEGEGWPVDLWAPGVTRLSGRLCTGAEIESFRTSAAEYLIEQEHVGREVGVRPYHDALGATVLVERQRRRRANVSVETLRRRDQSAVVDVLLEHVRQYGWQRCLAYVRTHLAAHAAKAGRLLQLLEDPRFACAADPGRLQLAIAATPGAARVPIAECHRLTVHLLGEEPGSNAYLLRLAAFYQGHRALAERIRRSHRLAQFDVLESAVDPLQSVGVAHTDWVTAVEPYDTSLGRRVASSSADRTIRLWDPQLPGSPPLAVLAAHTDCVRDIRAFHIDGVDYLASASDDGTVRVWDVSRDQGRLVQTLRGHTDWVRAVCVFEGRNGWRLASGGDDGTVRIWEIGGREDPIRTLSGHTSWVTSLAVVRTPAGWRLVSGSDDRTARIWDPEADPELIAICAGHTDCIHGVAAFVSATGHWAATASDDRTARIWHLDTGEIRQVLRGHGRPVRAVQALVVRDRPKLVTGSTDQRVRLWDAEASPDVPERILVGHNDWVRSVRVFPGSDQPRLVSGSDDGTLRTWDLSKADNDAPDVFGGSTRWIRAVCVLPTSPRVSVAAAGTEGRINVWEVEEGRLVAARVLAGHGDWIRALTTFTENNSVRVVSAGDDGLIRVWDPARTDEPLYTLAGHDGPVRGVCAFGTGAGRRLASVGDDMTIKIWATDRQASAAVASVRAHDDWIRCVTSVRSSAGWQLITGSDDQTVTVWGIDSDTSPARVINLLGHTDSVRALCAFNRQDRLMIASTSDDGSLRLWEPSAGTGVPLRTIEAHKASGLAVSYLPSVEGRLVTASADQSLKVWDTTGKWTSTIPTLAPNFAVAPAGGGRVVVGNQRGVLLVSIAERPNETV